MQLFTNNADSTLAASINAVVTSFSVAAGDGSKFPNPTGGDFFLVTILQKTGAAESNWEVMKCTARTGDVLTVVRGQEGTAAIVHTAGDPVSLRITAGSMTTESISEGATNKYFTENRVLASVLTGLSLASAAVVVATDSVLVAIGKLQKQLSNLLATNPAPSANPTFTGTATADVLAANVYIEKVVPILANTATTNIDLSLGTFFDVTIAATTAFTFSNFPASPKGFSFTLQTTNNATAGFAISFPASFKFPGGVIPPRTTAANAVDTWSAYTINGGVSCVASLNSQDPR